MSLHLSCNSTFRKGNVHYCWENWFGIKNHANFSGYCNSNNWNICHNSIQKLQKNSHLVNEWDKLTTSYKKN